MSWPELVWVDEDYDYSYSSDGQSRFGAYLRQRASLFDDDGEPLTAPDFAQTVWRIACGPVMSPPYVQLGHDVHMVTCRLDDNDLEYVVADVQVRLPHPMQVWDMRAAGWLDWTRPRSWSEDPGPRTEPDGFPALLFAVTFSITIPAHSLPYPKSTQVDVAMAKDAIGEICRAVNRQVGPDLESLLIRWQERRR